LKLMVLCFWKKLIQNWMLFQLSLDLIPQLDFEFKDLI
jgi:hypothetical protein